MNPFDDLTGAALRIRAARTELKLAMQHGRELGFAALNNGASEVAVAKHLGVDRNTIRRWQGK